MLSPSNESSDAPGYVIKMVECVALKVEVPDEWQRERKFVLAKLGVWS